MPTYAIGDIQGCFSALIALLKKIQFNEKKDTLWLTGDIVNRGPESLATLRFIKNLEGQHRLVLGNHDLHLLAVAHDAHPGWKDDTLQDVLKAPDLKALMEWLIQQPLLYHDETLGFTMVHAGLSPLWDLKTALSLSEEVSSVLQSSLATDFLNHMYGNHPDQWSPELTGYDRLRCITNYFTRARFCHPDGRLDLTHTGKEADVSDDLVPWFALPNRANKTLKIIFGHWAALGGVTDVPYTYALDTGCVWGHALTAMRLEDEKRFCVACPSL